MEEKQLFRFGEFELCVVDRSLRRGDENIALTPKMYDLLEVLVKNPDRVVEKEYLLKTVWPDSFVEEGNITYNIRQLRKALGDNVQDPLYIETIPRRGYRFIAEVYQPDAVRSSASPMPDHSTPPPHTKENWLTPRPTFAITICLLLIAVMGSAVWFSGGNRAKGAPILTTPFASEKLSTDGGVNHAVITPDGKTVVYTNRNGNKQSLWLRQLETSNNIQIIPPSESFFGGLAVSPDGNTIYLTRATPKLPGRQLDLYRMSIVGGVPQKLIAETQGWISVSPDGETISFVRCYYREDEYCSLWIANASDGRNERKLLSRPGPYRIADNKISPDGRKIAFAAGQSWTGSNEFQFIEVDIETGAERELTPERFFNINYITSLPDQSGWLITALKNPDKNFRIWQVSAAGGEATRLTADSETYSRLSLDASGRVLVTTRIEPDFKLKLYKAGDPNAEPRILADGASVEFAPDGTIFYAASMTGDQEIWSINADGSDQRQLTHDPAGDAAPIVSPDNKWVFFSSNRSGDLQVWRMAPDGTDQTQLSRQEGGYPLRVSPDGQWVYYQSGLQSTLRRVSVADGTEELVYKSPPAYFALSPDTTRIAGTQRKDNQYVVNVVSLATNQTEKTITLADPSTRPVFIAWSHDGSELAYITEDESRENRIVWLHALTSEKPRKVADLGTAEIFELSGFAISYDTKSFVVAQGTWNHNAMLIKGLKP